MPHGPEKNGLTRDLCHAARCQISSTVVDSASDSFESL
jgi:hypothetical protein